MSGLAGFVWRHRKAVVSMVILLTVAGAWSWSILPVAIFPRLTVPRIVVSANAGDLPVITTLSQVTRPLEAAVSTVWGVTRVHSTTNRGGAEVDVTFTWTTDMQIALQQTQSRVAAILASLPIGTTVTTELINPSIFPIMGVSLTSTTVTLDPAGLRTLALYTLRPVLARLPGVAQVRVTGGQVPEYLVRVDPAALSARGLTMQDLENALASSNTVSAVGHFPYSYQRYEVLVSGLVHGIDAIRAVTIATRGQHVPVTVGEVADVSRSVQPPTVLASANGQRSVVVDIVKQPQANTIAVADEVRAALASLRGSIPPAVRTQTFYDQSQIVHESEASVVEAILVGAVLALVVLMAFLSNLRAAVVVLSILPLTMLITFGLMRVMGETLNIMTLGALAIALGLVIDDGIVVVENIFHELERGNSRRDAVTYGLRGITPAMVGSSITTMAAFFPLTFLSGVTGQFFAPLALVMIATLAVSLALAMLLAPLLASWLLPQKGAAIADPEAAPHSRLYDVYSRALDFALRHRVVIAILLVPLMAGDYFMAGRLQTGFFPEFDEGAFVIDYHLPPGTSLAETDRLTFQVGQMLARTPEVSAWSRLTGARSGSGLELTEPSQGDILVRLKTHRHRSADEIIADLRHRIETQLPAVSVEFAQILQDGIGDIAGSPAPIEVKIFGDDMGTLMSLARKTTNLLSRIPGVVDANDGIVRSGPEITVQVDTRRASRLGLTTDAVAAAATAALNGAVATSVQEGEQTVGVRVRAEGVLDSITPPQVPDLRIAAPLAPTTQGGNGTVPLRQVAHVVIKPGSTEVRRENQRQMVDVTARLEGRDLGSAVKEVQAVLARDLRLPADYRIEYGGLYASQQESFAELGQVLLFAFLLVAVLLVMQLRSFRQTAALLAAAILSMTGVVLGLYLTGTPLDIASYTGAVMIVGIVTENGIVLFDFYNQLRRRDPDRDPVEAMEEAGRMRVRPILMTTVGAVLALLPLALGFGAGAAMQKPLAIAVIGGLCVSTLFTLIVAPVLFLLLTRRSAEPVIQHGR